jgi:hemimethylated DNA binding protein
MGIDDLEHGRAQPFYHVLVDQRDEEKVGHPSQNGLQYVAQELLQEREGVNHGDDFEHEYKDQTFAGFDPRTRKYIMMKDVAPSPA